MDNMLIILFIFICSCCFCIILSLSSFLYKNKETSSSNENTEKSPIYSTNTKYSKISNRGQICNDLQSRYPNIMHIKNSAPAEETNKFETNKCSDYFIYGDN
jgi:hypothetical protein